MNRFTTALLVGAISAVGSSAHAATVTWGDAFNIGHTQTWNILNTVHAATNGGTATINSSSIVEAISYGGNR